MGLPGLSESRPPRGVAGKRFNGLLQTSAENTMFGIATPLLLDTVVGASGVAVIISR